MVHDVDKIPEDSAADTYRMDEGKKVGRLAKGLFPGGIDIPEDFKENILKTKELVKNKQTLFEAGFLIEDLYARADILQPVEDGWNIIEVKSSTSVKPEHIHDLSFQKYVYEKAGLKIYSCYLLHLNNKYLKQGDINISALFTKEDVTAKVIEIQGVDQRIKEMLKIINNRDPPEVTIRNGCNNGTDCVSEDCWNFLPEGHVFELQRGGKKSYELLEAEILCIKDIPDTFKLNDNQQIQKKCAITGSPHINKEHLKTFIDHLTYPIHYLDFETFNPAIPLYDATRPHQQIPFQFSLHIDTQKAVEHYEFLHDSPIDPRELVLRKLKQAIKEIGSIVVFYQSFEEGRLKELGAAFPEYQPWINEVIKRMVDLYIPFKNFDYYSPKQKGSCSIKEVLLALTGKNYEDLNINNGSLASVSYIDYAFNNKKQLRNDLLTYCKLDTEGMLLIIQEIRKLVA